MRRLILLLAFAAAAPAAAQQAVNTDAATQPAKGVYYLRTQAHYLSFDGGDQTMLRASLSYGLTGSLSATVALPAAWRDVDDDPPGEFVPLTLDPGDEDRGVGDLVATLKWRFAQFDTGPLDTTRISLLAGASIPTGRLNGVDTFSSGTLDPMAGVTLTSIQGRHGVSADLIWRFNSGDDAYLLPGTGPDDALFYDLAYLYRLAPGEYRADTKDAWYGIIELNGTWETNGDHELRVGPGLLYEGRDWAAEVLVQWPAISDVDERPEMRSRVVVGLRFLL